MEGGSVLTNLRIKRFLLGLVAAISMIFGASLLGIQPASAATTFHSCPDAARICFYEDINYNGVFAVWNSIPRNSCRILPQGGEPAWPNQRQNNEASAIVLNWSGGTVAGDSSDIL